MDWLAVHSQDETDERLGMRKELQDVSSLFSKLRAIKINKPNIVGAGFETYLTEISSIENRRWPSHEGFSSFTKPFDAWMLRKLSHCFEPNNLGVTSVFRSARPP